MRRIINKLENTTFHTYGFEHPHTLRVFKLTDLMRRVCGYGY